MRIITNIDKEFRQGTWETCDTELLKHVSLSWNFGNGELMVAVCQRYLKIWKKTLKNRYRTNSLRDIMKKPFSALQQPVIWKTDHTFLFESHKQLYIAKSQHYVANKSNIELCVDIWLLLPFIRWQTCVQICYRRGRSLHCGLFSNVCIISFLYAALLRHKFRLVCLCVRTCVCACAYASLSQL